jgi:hypothetical protein
METEDVLKAIEDIEIISGDISDPKSQKNKIELSKSLKTHLDGLIDAIVKQIDVAEKEFLIEIVELLMMLNSKYKFDETLNSGIRYSILINYINALIYQKDWKFEKLSECLKDIQTVYESYLEVNNGQTLFSIKSKYFPKVDQYFGIEVLEKIRLALCLSETYLQHTAVFSQLGQHDNALKSCEKCFDLLMTVISRYSDIFKIIKMAGLENLKNCGQFSHDIIDYDIYLDFLKTLKIPAISANESWNSTFPNWKINKENVLKYIYQKIENQKQLVGFRTLSKKIEKDWVENFHISNIVKLQSYEIFLMKMTAGDFDENLILQTILTLACCVFSIAAENRFISYKEIKNKKLILSSNSEQLNRSKNEKERKNSKVLEDMSKDLNLQREPRFILSEKIHLKTLEILTFGFKDSIKLLNHCFQSYKKNYDFHILIIEEVDEPSFSTLRNSEYFYNQIDDKPNLQQVQKLNEKIINLMNREKQKTEIYNEENEEYEREKTPIVKSQVSINSKLQLSEFSFSKQNLFQTANEDTPRLDEMLKTTKEIQESRAVLSSKSERNVLICRSIKDVQMSEMKKPKMENEEFKESKFEKSDRKILQGSDSFKQFKFEKTNSNFRVDNKLLNFIKHKPKSLSINYKNLTIKHFTKTSEANPTRYPLLNNEEQAEDQLLLEKRERTSGSLSRNKNLVYSTLRNFKSHISGKEQSNFKKMNTLPISKTWRESKTEKFTLEKQQDSPHSGLMNKFSLLINQMNQSSKSNCKLDKQESVKDSKNTTKISPLQSNLHDFPVEFSKIKSSIK